MAFYEGNDWNNLEDEVRLPWLVQALDEAGDFGRTELNPATLSRAGQVIERWLDSDVTHVGKVIRKRVIRNFAALQQTSAQIGLNYPSLPSENDSYELVLAKAKKLAASWGGTFYLAYFPQAERYSGLLPRDFAYDEMRSIVLDAAQSAGVQVIDLVEAFKGEQNAARYYAANGHFSEDGSEFVARMIAAALPKSRLETRTKDDPPATTANAGSPRNPE
jgi:hypothetical protein